MGLASLTAHVAGTVLTAAALNNNENAIINQLNGNIEAVNLANLAVTTAKINTDAVTFDKMDDDGNFGPFTGTWEFDAAVNFDGAVDFDSTVDFSGATILGATPFVFEGASSDGFETSVAVTDPTADRTLTIPNEDVNLGQQIIKGWVVFDGTSVTTDLTGVSDHFNVASVTDNGTGDYTIAWDVDFASANYAVGATGTNPSNTAETIIVFVKAAAAGTLNVLTDNDGGTNTDSVVRLMAIGDR